MKIALIPGIFWIVAATIGATYGLLFASTRRPVAFRLRRIAWAALVFLTLRALLLVGGRPLEPGVDTVFFIVTLIGALLLMSTSHLWLVRSSLSDFRGQLDTATRRLLLSIQETRPGVYSLESGKTSCSISVRTLQPRLLLVRLPRRSGRDKVTLLIDWLSRQYPGPIPRPHIVLKRST